MIYTILFVLFVLVIMIIVSDIWLGTVFSRYLIKKLKIFFGEECKINSKICKELYHAEYNKSDYPNSVYVKMSDGEIIEYIRST